MANTSATFTSAIFGAKCHFKFFCFEITSLSMFTVCDFVLMCDEIKIYFSKILVS